MASACRQFGLAHVDRVLRFVAVESVGGEAPVGRRHGRDLHDAQRRLHHDHRHRGGQVAAVAVAGGPAYGVGRQEIVE
ncbi:hypothetical protein G6F62_015758 [Rhizopus arrhizus]|nr:hypothetical protein G6F62_015758 [Rhizopus arrhizus]KAG1482488.1 hypothetical protein G6F53_014088 [Rhizopus delemar]